MVGGKKKKAAKASKARGSYRKSMTGSTGANVMLKKKKAVKKKK